MAASIPLLRLRSVSNSVVIPCSPQPPVPRIPSSTSRITHSRIGGSRGAGDLRRYEADPVPACEGASLDYAVSDTTAYASLSRTAPCNNDNTASPDKNGYTRCEEAADGSLQATMSVSPAPRCLPPTAAAVASGHRESPTTTVLLRYSCGNTTRILYADGHVETKVSINPKNLTAARPRPPASLNCRRRCAEDPKTALPRSPPGTVTKNKADPPTPIPANQPWLIESFNAVAQVYQQQALPPRLDSITPQFARVSLFSDRSSHATENRLLSPRVSMPSPSTATYSPTSLATAQTPPLSLTPKQPELRSMTDVNIPFSSQETLSQPSTSSRGDRGVVGGPRGSAKGDDTHGRRGRGGLPPVAPTEPSAVATIASANPHTDGCETTSTAERHNVVAGPHFSESVAGNAASTEASDDGTRAKIVALQQNIRTELAVEHCTRAHTFASRYARDISASPSLFSVRFPFAPLSELYAFEDRPPEDRMAAPAASSGMLTSDLPSVSSLGPQATLSTSSAVGERAHTSAGYASSRHLMPDVLLPHAQTTTPSGFTIPELLQDRLLPREPPALQLKLKELTTTRNLIGAHDSPACRLIVSFVWYAILRCRKAHREQSLVNDFHRLSRALSNTFPHVLLGDALPALDVLQQLLVELLTCSRYSADIEKARNGEQSAAAATSAEGPDKETNTTGNRENASPALPRMSIMQRKGTTRQSVDANTTPSMLPLHLPLHEHSAHFPLLLSPAWSKLVHTGAAHPTSSDRRPESKPGHTEQQQRPLRHKERGILPAPGDLDTLCSVYHDLWLHHSEYVQLCLYEELLYKQLARQFGDFVRHIHKGHTSAEAAVALTATTTTTTTAAAASVAPPEVIDSVLNSMLLLMSHATYYNCVFCFPNDFYSGLFDEGFRSDVMRWLSFCCHGVVLTHVHVRHWPVPIKGDHTDAQIKREEALKRELEALGLVPPGEQLPAGTHHQAAVAISGQGVPQPTVSLELATESGSLDLSSVAENSEARLAYELDRYGRSVALHMADLKRCMARLQRRHVTVDSHSLGGAEPLPRGVSSAVRTPHISSSSSTASTTAASTRRPSCSHFGEKIKSLKGCPRPEEHKNSVTLRCVSLVAARVAGAGTSPRQSTASPSMTKKGSLAPPPTFDARRKNPRSRGTSSTCGPAAPPHPDRQEGTRSQYRTSAAAAVGENLVKMAAELRGVGHTGGATGAALQTDGHQSTRGEGAPARANRGPSLTLSTSDTVSAGSAEVDLAHDNPDEGAVTIGQGNRRKPSESSLLSSYPLCVCPRPIRDYWLLMLLRTPFLWTTRTAMATAAAIAGTEVLAARYEVQQLSTQLMLWPSRPIGADGEALPQQDVCRLQVEPWRALFSAVIAVPPISKEARQAADQVELYGKVLSQQQAHLYKLVELHRHTHHVNQQRFSPEDSKERVVLALASLTPTVTLDMMLGEPAAGFDTLQTLSFSATGQGSGSAGGVADMGRGGLPALPLIAPESSTALGTSTATPRPMMLNSSSPALNQRRYGKAGTYQGSTSPFSMMYSSYLAASSCLPSIPVPNLPHRIGAAGTNSCRDSVEGTLPGTTPILFALAPSSRNSPLDQGIAPGTDATATTPVVIVSASTTPSGEAKMNNRNPGRSEPLQSRGFSGKGSRTRKTKIAKNRFHNTFSITAFSSEETKLPSGRMGPLMKEATDRHVQLLADMEMIQKRDQIARQHYITQHLKLSNAVAYTESEAMVRRCRALSRLALERLMCADVPDVSTTRGMAKGPKDFKL
ncbi:hypothetical protein JKF63_07862 [Porcisia hertigi]|uniref:Uncharacterized protein n=1 Tax=Porcisia hertigi TaxID=2761500 RepID=A0A836LJN3_9TRYP|nr:hypothetical protein JKF63_07862 [Porcisia hertigi]